ncbi:hypothetical protein DFH28DRAFT_881650 [Melampsora americana]|nr:hypothetical protein DFH28DRAFT_881650 [Melampsora americana]
MPSKRLLSGLNKRPKEPKAVTPLQLQQIALRKKDDEHTNASTLDRLRRLKNQEDIQRPPGHEIHNHLQYTDQPEDAEDAPVAEVNLPEYDINHFMPRPDIGDAIEVDQDDPVAIELKKQLHLAERLAHENRWAWQYATMLPTFLRCRLETSNWGNEERWKEDFRPPCHCANKTQRNVDLVDLLSRRRVKVFFCKNCDLSDPARLLQMGFMAASPKQPSTAFSLRLLKHYHTVWLRCATATQGFCEALNDILDDNSPAILTSKGHPRDWRIPFTAAMDAYRAIILQISKIETERLHLSSLGVLAANCPKCFGPPVLNDNRPMEPQVVICLDGNFQHKRHDFASVTIPGFHPPRPELFLDPKLVEAKARYIARGPQEGNGEVSNGEGLERVWMKTAPLVSLLRFLVQHTKKYSEELAQAQRCLAKLLQKNRSHTTAYFRAQWTRQRELQLKAINVKTKEKRARVEVLVQLEEDLIQARNQLLDLDPHNVPIRTVEHRNHLLNLPRSLANLEAKVQELAEELGNAELVHAQRGGNNRIKALLTVQVSMGFLYEAKYDVVQHRAHAATRTAKYNAQFDPAQRLREPTFDEVLNMDILDPFWDEVALNHPDEPWSSCQSTKEGIMAFRSQRSCEEELRRLGREVRQLMLWGLDHQSRIDAAKPNVEANGTVRAVEWNSIYIGLAKTACRLWRRWQHGLLDVLNSTSKYVDSSRDIDRNLVVQWSEMVSRTSRLWEDIQVAPIFWENDPEDKVEEEERLPPIAEDPEDELNRGFFGLFIS